MKSRLALILSMVIILALTISACGESPTDNAGNPSDTVKTGNPSNNENPRAFEAIELRQQFLADVANALSLAEQAKTYGWEGDDGIETLLLVQEQISELSISNSATDEGLDGFFEYIEPRIEYVSDMTVLLEGWIYIYENSESEKTTPPTKTPFEPLTYSGTGDKVVNDINLPSGSYYAHLVHEGSRNFIVRFYYGDDEYDYCSLANKSGKYSGESLLNDILGESVYNGSLEIKADGKWTITIHEVSGTDELPISGQGDVVTGLIDGLSGRRTVTLTHSGSRNFIVRIYTFNGGKYDYEGLANKSGNYTGETAVSLKSGEQYYFSVQADGDWTISIN